MSIGKIDLPLEKWTDECLGVKPHIAALTRFICQCDTPMTIAIQGDWGTGKTSFMQVVEKQLTDGENKGKYGTVRFNTWQFSQFDLQDDVPVVLLMELLRAFGCEESKAKKFLVGGLKKAGGIIGAIMGGAEGREAMKQLLESDPTNMITQIRELKKDLEKAVGDKQKKDNIDRIVVFIDDLDRMNPGKAVGLLEIIKNFLDIKGCVYVLAVDYGVVSRGVREKYGQDMDELKGRSFFDKIIQLPFNLPVAQYEIENYLKELFELDDTEARFYKKLAEDSVGTNPRSLKRMANTLKLIELVAIEKSQFDKEHEKEFRRALFASLCLQMAFEPVYAQILGSGEYMDFLRDLDSDTQGVLEKFKESIQKIPGKPEIVEKRLKNFFKSLDDSIPTLGDDKNYDLFDAVMRLSGVTASGAQTAEEKENQMKSFDPKLMSYLKDLCAQLDQKYSSFFKMIDGFPTDGGDEGNEIYVPITWGDSILSYTITLTREGIERCFYSWADDINIRKAYREFIEKNLALHIQNISKPKGSRTLFKLPILKWESDSSEKSIKATHERLGQVKETLNNDCSIILPIVDKHLQSPSKVLDHVHQLLQVVEQNLETMFPRDNWEIKILEKGNILYKDWCILTIHKRDWQDDTCIYISSIDGNGKGMSLSFYYEGVTPSKKDLKFVLDTFKHKKEELNLVDVAQDDEHAIMNTLGLGFDNWLDGSIFDGNLRYILNEAQEKALISSLIECSKLFLSIEETLDAIAIEE